MSTTICFQEGDVQVIKIGDHASFTIPSQAVGEFEDSHWMDELHLELENPEHYKDIHTEAEDVHIVQINGHVLLRITIEERNEDAITCLRCDSDMYRLPNPQVSKYIHGMFLEENCNRNS